MVDPSLSFGRHVLVLIEPPGQPDAIAAVEPLEAVLRLEPERQRGDVDDAGLPPPLRACRGAASRIVQRTSPLPSASSCGSLLRIPVRATEFTAP